MKQHLGFWWPHGAEGYGERYVRHLKDLDVAIDYTRSREVVVQAGGHVGVWPAHLSRHFASVYTFEPDPDNFLALCQNVHPTVHKFMAAVGFDRGCVELVFHPKNIGGHHVGGARGRTPVIRIDDLSLPACDLIVLDVEGFEQDAVVGAAETIERYKPVLMLEMRGHMEKYGHGSTEDLRKTLKDWGYVKAEQADHDEIYCTRWHMEWRTETRAAH